MDLEDCWGEGFRSRGLGFELWRLHGFLDFGDRWLLQILEALGLLGFLGGGGILLGR